ncbi:hypothetical protein [Aurantiacibacter spongiae]|uniref:Uncharacterized protein n=1 Tax=Aurantiacibacter spongiae TaxID=2488860 RepID=A0A3N5CSZ6_9SPHN|nr:hypothetical protein [Aurantiacibacter spongiae]RPF72293.1 hypothetical protein EG799_12160 [Aurantiacibacter spongiae]
MAELLQANWIWVVVALVIGVLVAWWIFAASRRTTIEREDRPEEVAGGARRNQALIDSPPSARRDEPSARDIAEVDTQGTQIRDASAGPVSAAANEDRTAAAGEAADAEAGAPGSAREAMKQVPPSEETRHIDGEDRASSPPATTPPPSPSPAPAPAPAPSPSSAPLAVEGDELTRMKGVGPKLAAQLREMGVTTFAQIAAWDESDVDRVDSRLGRFQGRIRRDDWVEQARLLSREDIAAYEEKFGRTA